jgi:cytochrome c oxidase cbb3-type subunit 3
MSNLEKEPLLDHNYDGIQELDNPLPRWWVYLFYATIVFGILYFVYYGFGIGPDLHEELESHMQVIAPQTQVAIDYDALENDPAKIEAGKAIYAAKCAACHGPDGGGTIGPNLTDTYWIHGEGRLSDIVTVIQKGVPEKGMLSWETLLSPEDLQSVAVYVHSLKGTTPATPKAPEGNPGH